jgi:hypothetical protein
VAVDVGAGAGTGVDKCVSDGVRHASDTTADSGSREGVTSCPDACKQRDVNDNNPTSDRDGGNDNRTFVPPPDAQRYGYRYEHGHGHGNRMQDAPGTDEDESLLSIEEVDMEELQELLLLEGEGGHSGVGGASTRDGDDDDSGGGGDGGGGLWRSLWGAVDDDNDDGSVASSVASVASFASYASDRAGAAALAKKMR